MSKKPVKPVSASADTSIFISLNEVPHPAKW
jgi:hypothetical protein